MSLFLRNLPNMITMFRMLASLPLLWIPALSVPFYVLYTICGLSDVLDGVVARHWHLQSVFGARMDSVADLLFWGIVLFRVLPVLLPRFGAVEYTLMAIIVVLRVINYAAALVKFHGFPALHTWLNKLTACGLFLAVYLLNWVSLRGIAVVLFIIALAAVSEELLIHLTAKELRADVQGFHAVRRDRHEKV